MKKDMDTLVDVTPENVLEQTLFCIKDTSSPGFKNKRQWFEQRYAEGLRMKILKSAEGKALGFIEYLPAEQAWRPVDAPGFMFVHCMYVYSNKDKGKGKGSQLLQACEADAKARKMAGVCVMTSKGSWIAGSGLFEKNGYTQTDQRGRFELLTKTWNDQAPAPRLKDWTAQQQQYQGWHLIYADQCPWHDKAVKVLEKTAQEAGIELNIWKLNSAREAQEAPSGFGVFSLVKDGRLIEDHYISETRFKNILKKELSNGL